MAAPQRSHGPALTPDLTGPKGVLGLAALFLTAQPGACPIGQTGFKTQAETETWKVLARRTATPPELSLDR